MTVTHHPVVRQYICITYKICQTRPRQRAKYNFIILMTWTSF